MEGMCGFHSIVDDDYNTDKVLLSSSSPECSNFLIPTTTTTTIDHGYSDDQNLLFSGSDRNNFSPFRSDFNDLDDSFHLQQCRSGISESSSEIILIHPPPQKLGRARASQEEDYEDNCSKAKIASHPSYPKLLHAYIDCQKVGAPPEIACLLDEIKEESGFCRRRDGGGSVATTCLGADPELDEFMETYCDILVKYKLDLERPFDEATTFLNKIEMQLSNLGKDDSSEEDEYYTYSGGGGVDNNNNNAEEQVELGLRNQEEDREIKERLLRKYGDHLSALKLEFSKKKKKGKLPKESRLTLLQWWNAHYKWPYPTEADKVHLAEITGLDQKQINNWFINQRKRHWKPSDNMQFAVMGNCSGQQQFIDHDF